MKHLISDTREKKNQHVLDYFEAVGIKYEIAKLDFGDYMDAYRPGLVIDRKQNIAELAKNVVGKDRGRFVRELERAQAAGSKMVILVEQNRYKDRGKWISVKEPIDLMLWSSPHTKIRGERVFRSVSSLIHKYGISVRFCDKRTTGRNILRIIYGDSYE